MRPGDIPRLTSVGSPAVRPDGLAVACTLTRADATANRYRSGLWLVDVDRRRPPRPLTGGDHVDSSPVWSPDGRRLAFVRTTVDGDGPPITALLVVGVDEPGEAVTVTTGRDDVTAPAWSPDGALLAWTARVRDADALEDDDAKRRPRRITTLLSRLEGVGWIVDRRSQVLVARVDGTGTPRQVTDGPFEHEAPAWSPDGTRLVVGAGRHEGWDLDGVADLWVAELGPVPDAPVGPAPLRRLTSGGRVWSAPAWSPEGTRIAALTRATGDGYRHTGVGVLTVGDGEAEGWVEPTAGIDRSFAPYPGARAPIWLDADHVLSSCEDHGTVRVLRLDASAATEPVEVAGGRGLVADFDAVGPTLALSTSTPTTLPELAVVPLDGHGAPSGPQRALTAFGAPLLAAVPPAPVERLSVPSPAGDGDIDVWLVRPPGLGEGDAAGDAGRWPLVLQVHGGPSTQHAERYFDEWQYLAAAGFVVVGANPHGSTGSTEAWVRAIRSPRAEIDPGTGWGGIDADDLLAVVDAAVAHLPAIDPARVAVIGGSYGGYMTSWLLATTDRFACGVSERAVNDLLLEERSSDIAGLFSEELGVSAVEHPEELVRMSPVAHAAGIDVPLQIIHSEGDLRCPTDQADTLFTTLRLLGTHHRAEYWRFPAEGHELSRSGSPAHRVQRAELVVDFLSRHLGPGPTP